MITPRKFYVSGPEKNHSSLVPIYHGARMARCTTWLGAWACESSRGRLGQGSPGGIPSTTLTKGLEDQLSFIGGSVVAANVFSSVALK